jgi:glycosyltransferase involved in cell wall biosynthesis
MECQWLEQLDAAVIEKRINAADLVLGCSNFIAEGVRRRFPSLAQRCSHIYNGADIAVLARPAGVQPTPKQILFAGRLAPEKGVHILLDAFRIVLAQQPDAHLELIGPEKIIPLEVILPPMTIRMCRRSHRIFCLARTRNCCAPKYRHSLRAASRSSTAE